MSYVRVSVIDAICSLTSTVSPAAPTGLSPMLLTGGLGTLWRMALNRSLHMGHVLVLFDLKGVKK